MAVSEEKMRAFYIDRGYVGCGEMEVQLLTETAKYPTYGSNRAAGLDLYADIPLGEKIVIDPTGRGVIKCGIAIALPPGTYGRVAPRSGLAVKHGIDVMAGVIDEDYRGEVGVVLINLGQAPFTIVGGDRIAQLVVERYVPVVVTGVDRLDTTLRGGQGYGSTGVN